LKDVPIVLLVEDKETIAGNRRRLERRRLDLTTVVPAGSRGAIEVASSVFGVADVNSTGR